MPTSKAGVDAGVAFYGFPPQGPPRGQVCPPSRIFFGEHEGFFPVDDAKAWVEEQKKAGVDSDIVIYPGAGHAFFNNHRPEVYNAFNRDLHAALHEALGEAQDAAVRCVVVTGAGRGFCAGQDLKEFGEVSGSIREALEQTYHPNIRRVRALEKPVIAAVNGPAAGAGLSFACACDIRVASDAASFCVGAVLAVDGGWTAG